MSRWHCGRLRPETFNISAAFNDITMRVIVRTMFGTQVTDDEFDRLEHGDDPRSTIC